MKVSNISTVYLNPLASYVRGQATRQKLWIVEGTNTLPSSAKTANASSLLPNVIEKNQEVIIRDATSGRLLVAIYRNRIGEEALNFMHETAKTMFQFRRKVARESLKNIDQGALAAAGYLCTRQCGIFTHVRNIKNLDNIDELQEHEAKVVANIGLLYNYAMHMFPDELTDDIKQLLEHYDLPRLDGNMYGSKGSQGFTINYCNTFIELPFQLGLCEAYASQNYSKHVHTDNNFLKYAWGCICARNDNQNSGHDFEGGNFFLLEYGILIKMDSNTLWCWPEKDEHGTTVLPPDGYQMGWSQNLAKKTVTAATNWKNGQETSKKKQLRLQQLQQVPLIYQVFKKAEKKIANLLTIVIIIVTAIVNFYLVMATVI